MKFPGRIAATGALIFTVAALYAQSDYNLYHFDRLVETSEIKPYSNTIYTANSRGVHTLKGHVLHSAAKDTITDFEVNPTGTSFVVVERKKKGKVATDIYSTLKSENKRGKFDTKKYGNPVCVAYTPDARGLAVATPRAVYMVNPQTMVPTAAIAKLPFVPQQLLISPNGYYLVGIAGDKVAIYNLEDRTLRRVLDMGEKVNDVKFSPDNNDMSVLTADGLLSIFNLRTLDLRKMVDDLGEGRAFAYNFDGKYVGVVTDTSDLVVVNLLNDRDREHFELSDDGASDIEFITDAEDNTLMAYGMAHSIEVRRMPNLKPFYNRLIADETETKLDEWLQMMPGETMEQYRARVTDESRARQRSLFEYEVTTKLAGDLLGGMDMNLGSYDRNNGVLAIDFSEMPTIFIPVPENEAVEFKSADDVSISDVLYGVNEDDSFEIVYAKVTNNTNGKSYIYDNLARASMDYLANEDAISLEVLQQQQMEEIKLQELREQVLQEARDSNVISDNTNISVKSRAVSDYDANGDKIINYEVVFTYDVAPGFSATEDFGPGKYHVEESGAATSMLKIVEQAFDGDMKQYLEKCKKMRVAITGTADATPIVHGIAYDGAYGTYTEEPVYVDGQLSALSVDPKEPIHQNQELAFVRALGVKDYLEKKVPAYNDINKDYRYEVNVSKDKGSEFRRITVNFTFVDAF